MLQKITVPFAQRIRIVIEHPGSGGAEDVGLKELKKTRIATLSNICIVTKVGIRHGLVCPRISARADRARGSCCASRASIQTF